MLCSLTLQFCECLLQVFKQILETLSYCHQLKPHGIVHGDIGLETVGLASVSDAACAPHAALPQSAAAAGAFSAVALTLAASCRCW